MIIATAIPKITDDFHDVGEVGWFASSYLLTQAAFQPLCGRLSTFYSPKWIFVASIGLFEVGSAICGAAPNSTAFILGRAIAGLGSAGVFSGAIVIIVVRDRSLLAIIHRKTTHCTLAYCTTTQTTHVHWFYRCRLRHCVCHRTTTRGCLYGQGHLEMVFLHQSSHWRRCHCHRDIHPSCPKPIQRQQDIP